MDVAWWCRGTTTSHATPSRFTPSHPSQPGGVGRVGVGWGGVGGGGREEKRGEEESGVVNFTWHVLKFMGKGIDYRWDVLEFMKKGIENHKNKRWTIFGNLFGYFYGNVFK